MENIYLNAEIEIVSIDHDKDDSTGLTQEAWDRLFAAVTGAGFTLTDVTKKENN